MASIPRAVCLGGLSVAIVACLAVPGWAQDAARGGAALPPDGRPVYVEALQLETPPRDRFGQPVLSSEMVWRPMCGSDPDAMSVEQLQAMAARHADLFGLRRGDEPQPVGTAFNITFDFGPAVPQEAEDALLEVAAVLEARFGDLVTMNIIVGWQDMGGGVLGATGSAQSDLTYSSVRDSLVADMDSGDSIQSFLPTGSTIPVRYNDNLAFVTNENEITVTWGNIKALGGTTGTTVAGMTFNSAFTWDFDPSNGIDGGTWDFQSVVAHEIGHAMGFVSDVDDVGNSMAALDMFRFRNTDDCCDYDPDTVEEFTTTPRMVDFNMPNDGHTFDIISVEYRLADGSPYQASHFREQGATIGIMDPAIGSGQSFWPNFFQTSDEEVFDAIGWDYPSAEITVPLPFFDDFPDIILNANLWVEIEGADGSTRGINEPSPEYSLNLDGTNPGGDVARSAFLDTTSTADPVLQYWYQRTGADDSPEEGDDLVVDYLDNKGNWTELARHLGSGPDMTTFEFVSLPLPPDAIHAGFRIRYRAISNDLGGDDDWFVDDVCIGGVGDCPQPVACPDLDGDGTVSTSDLLDLLGQWGSDPGGPPDFDGDGIVSTSDLLMLLGAWGPCP